MASENKKSQIASKNKRHSTVASLVNTIEWLVIAFILAFTFRAFVLEAFRIPTGSMAPTLRGDHFAVTCDQCGHVYDYGFIPRRYRPGAPLYRATPDTRCPNCGHFAKPVVTKSNGDRILVFKGKYHFKDPDRWDVFVFKNPTQPRINYIKRVIGKPGEKVEIIDGDIYINDKIARKPSKVQNELWMPVFNNDFQPARPLIGSFNGHTWKQPFINTEGSQWDMESDNGKTFSLDSKSDQLHTIYYDTSIGNDFKCTYGYNNSMGYSIRQQCSDLKLEYYAKINEADSTIGAVLSKYGREYVAKIEASGKMELQVVFDGKTTTLANLDIEPVIMNQAVKLSFANVDHMLKFNFGSYEMSYDLGTQYGLAGTVEDGIYPKAEILGNGNIKLSHISLMRDIYYVSYRGDETVRAGHGNPFYLGDDEFFACGDNSPWSADSRLWTMEGIGNNDKLYRQGVVPRDYLVGEAFYVYWPSGFRFSINPKLKALSRLPIVPNISKMRLIYGGKPEGSY